jgi:hypothetical protein
MKCLVRSAVIAFLLLIIPCLAFANIGENFAPAGTYLSGSAGITTDFGSLDDIELSYWEFWIEPTFGFFPANNLSIGLSPSFYLWNYPATYLDPRWQVSGGLNLSYYFVAEPDASTGLVPAIGLNWRIFYDRYYEEIWTNLTPDVRLYYFITDRIAPYLSLSGIGVGYDLTYTEFYTWLEPQVKIGIAWFLPSRDVVLFAKR